MKIDERVTIEVERDVALRCHEYQVTTVDREGNPAQGFIFFVSDRSGRIFPVGPTIDMTEEEANG